MKIRFLIPIAVLSSLAMTIVSAPDPSHHWALESTEPDGIVLRGDVAVASGMEGRSIALDGASVLEVTDSTKLTHGSAGFSVSIWVNPYAVGGDQQMIMAKNRYSRNEREWGVMIDRDGKFRLYAWQERWRTVDAGAILRPGHWHFVGVTFQSDKAEFWIDGKLAGELPLEWPIAETAAPLTFGGVNDGGRIRQTLFGALDEIRLFDRPLSPEEMTALYRPVESTHEIPERPLVGGRKSDPYWDSIAKQHAAADRTALVFDGRSPNQLSCDTTVRKMPDGSWVMIMLGGGDTEPLPQNRVFLTRSHDEGETWSPMEPIDLGVKAKNPNAALVPSELMVHDGRCTVFVATHDGTFADWKEWMTHSDDSGRTWSGLKPAPGRLNDRTFIRNHIVTRDGRILLPFQHYLRVAETRTISKQRRFSPPTNPRNGVLMSEDGGKTWTEHGDIRLTDDDDYHGWAENNIVELADGRIAMIIRGDRLGGVLYYAESPDGGRTWPEFAKKTSIPNPGSKATLYGLGGNRVALLHNPNPRGRHPLSLWVSFDGMQTWPYQRVLVPESSKGPGKALNYPDGFVSEDRKWLHFTFDDARYRAVYIGARLPDAEDLFSLWDDSQSLPKAAEAPVLEGVEFSVIKPHEPGKDGGNWLLGTALAWHKGKLYASYGFNQGAENTASEEAHARVSEDGGKTWGEATVIDGGEGTLGVSHGVFLSHGGRLWAFHGAFYDHFQRTHTLAYVLDETNGRWQSRGPVIGEGFWPLQEPLKMEDGNWIMAGARVDKGYPDLKGNLPAVAISHGDDLTKWDLVAIPVAPGVSKVWGESTVIVSGKRILNIARWGGQARALAAVSNDYGRTWTSSKPSNLKMATSKPYAGTLSTGQHYLVCTNTADSGGRRSPLTIAVSRPGEEAFSKVFVIRHAVFPEGPGPSHADAQICYPYAVEQEGNLYVGYAVKNHRTAEMAVIPINRLKEIQ